MASSFWGRYSLANIIVPLITILLLIGCGKSKDPSIAKPEKPGNIPQKDNVSQEPNPSDKSLNYDVYAKGIVILKSGKIIKGDILLQCPGYLTVCFRVGSSDPGDSVLVSEREVLSVTPEKALSELDPIWINMKKEYTVYSADHPPSEERLGVPHKE